MANVEAEITQELIDMLLEHGLVVSNTEEGVILGFTSDKLIELTCIADESEDKIVLILVKPKSTNTADDLKN